MDKNYYAVIMAGGVGSRFWPVSTTTNPKQFHDMLGTGMTLLQKTFGRLAKFIPRENIYILTNERYNELVLEQLPMLVQEQVVLEPAMRNTAPCILYAALKIMKMNPDALMMVAPSDHWIEDEAAFARDVMQCFDRCKKEEALCTLGITPSFPNTGYGYIEFEPTKDARATAGMKPVRQFREKPTYDQAKIFLEQGNFLWNAGIFLWSARTILNAFQEYQPQLYHLFAKGMDVFNTTGESTFIQANYAKAENISIDYAILENSDSIYVLPASFDWNDLGTWGSLYDKLDKDVHNNAVINSVLMAQDADGNMIRANKGKLVVVEGLSDYIIVDKDEILLIVPKSREQDIKAIVAKVKDNFGAHYI